MMARSAPAPIIDGVSTMSKLASFLRQARDITGQIRHAHRTCLLYQAVLIMPPAFIPLYTTQLPSL